MSQPVEVFGLFLDPNEPHASKRGLVIRRGQYQWQDGTRRLQFQPDQGKLLAIYSLARDADAALKLREAQMSWLYVHRYAFSFWTATAITPPWAHFINHDPWVEAPRWVGAMWFFFGTIALVLVEFFWPKGPNRYVKRQTMREPALTHQSGV